MISTLVWNFRGVGARNTRIHLMEMLKIHKPRILILLETKIHSSKIKNFLEKLGFSDMMAVKPLGFVGGL